MAVSDDPHSACHEEAAPPAVSASAVAAGKDASMVCIDKIGSFDIAKQWTINGVVVPTKIRDGERHLVLSKAWRSNENWLKIIANKSKSFLITTSESGPWSNLRTCCVASQILAGVESARGKSTRRMRRVDKDGQCVDLVSVTIDGCDTSVEVFNELGAVCMPATIGNIEWLLQQLCDELASHGIFTDEAATMTTPVKRIGSNQSLSVSTPDDHAVAQGDRNEDDSDGGESGCADQSLRLYTDGLPKGVYYAQSRGSFRAKFGANGMKDFHIRKRSKNLTAEIDYQKQRALHYFNTGAVMPQPCGGSGKKRRRANTGDDADDDDDGDEQ
jgi:hypothetical protein